MRQLSASELYALSQTAVCSGPDDCHWCGSPCRRSLPHDDPTPPIGVKRREPALRPGNTYICVGCWLWRRTNLSVNFLSGGVTDRQTPSSHSWWITSDGAWGIRHEDHGTLGQLLLNPPLRFCLMLLGELQVNHIQTAMANDLAEIKSDTPLTFTVDGKPLTYTVYDLREALKSGPVGRDPGTTVLLRLLGSHAPKLSPEGEQPGGSGRKHKEIQQDTPLGKRSGIDPKETRPNKRTIRS